MKNHITLLSIVMASIICISLASISTGAALQQCCIINNSVCTFWNLGTWTQAKDLCQGLMLADPAFNTLYFSYSCTNVAIDYPNCQDGYGGQKFIDCGDGVCDSGIESCSICPSDCGVCEGEKPCTPNWKCTGWGNCTANSLQSRTCTNLRDGCDRNKPSETQACTYVAPKTETPAQVPQTQEQPTPEIIVQEEQTNTEAQQQPATNSPITGQVTGINSLTGALKTPAGITVTILVFLVIIALVFLALKFFKK